jgi:hypothetical protein
VVKTGCLYLAVLVLALSVRCAYLVHGQNETLPLGFTETERAALSLARKGVLGNVFGDTGASAHTAPLYPALLAPVYRFADWQGVNPRVYQELCSILITCFAICLVPLLARRLGLHPVAGWLAAVLLCLLPGNRCLETSGACEQPLIAVGVPVLLLALVSLRECRWRSPRQLASTALLIGVLALLGPMFLSMAALMILSQYFTLRTDRRAVLIGTTVIATVTMLLLLPWAYRNYRELGGWVWTRSNFGLELWIGNNPHATGQTWFPHYAVYHPFVNPQQTREYARLGELAYMHEKGKQAKDWIGSNPGRFAWLTACRARWFWFPNGYMVVGDRCKWVAPLYWLSTLGMLGGLIHVFRTGNPHRWLLVAAIVGFYMPYAVTHVDVRYRYPLAGLIGLLCCDFAVRVGLWVKHRTVCRL